MLNADVDAIAETLARQMNEPQRALVRKLDEISFTPAFRAMANEELVRSEEIKGADLVRKAQEHGPAFAESVVRAHLLGIVSKIEDAQIRQRFESDRISTKDLLGALNYASSADLQNFARTMYTLSLANQEVRAFCADKFDNALGYYSVFEKKALIDTLLAEPQKNTAAPFIGYVLRSSGDLAELVQLVNGAGKDKLISTNSAELKEYVAHAVIGPQLRAIRFPERLAAGVAPEATDKAFDAIIGAHQEVLKICAKHPELSSTQVARDFVKTAEDNLKNLATERGEYVVVAPIAPAAPTPPVPPAAPRAPTTDQVRANPALEKQYEEQLEEYQKALVSHQADLAAYAEKLLQHQRDWKKYETALKVFEKESNEARESLREVANVYSGMGQINYKYGVNITYGDSEWLGFEALFRAFAPAQERWKERDIADIKAVLDGIPEGHVLFSPLLREIERVTSLGWGVLGARYEHGLIKIADVTIGHRGISEQYEGRSSLAIVLAHEIGHGIQIGAGPSWFTAGSLPRVEQGEARYDFDEWAKLGGWESIDRSRWEWSGSKIKLDGKEVPVDEPIEHNGERIVLVPMGRNILMRYNADAEFSSRWYAKASPWEDFAEAFSEYIFLPERLIKDAPNKFLHLEQEFRKYEGNERLQQLLKKSLEDRSNSQRPDINQMRDAWNQTRRDPWRY